MSSDGSQHPLRSRDEGQKPRHPISDAWKIIPIFHSSSIERTEAFFSKVLGFETSTDHPDERGDPTFLSVAAGNHAAANIYFFRSGGEGEKLETSAARIGMSTRGLEHLHEMLRACSQKGEVEMEKTARDEPWGFREFAIKDLDGNILTFFRYLEGGNPGDDNEEPA